MRVDLEAARPDALVVIAAEHFANFFMNNMPSLRDRHGRPLRRPDRGSRLARHRQGPRARATATSHAGSSPSVMQTRPTWRTPRSGDSTTGSWCRCTSSRRATTCRSSRSTSTARGRRSRRCTGRGRSASRSALPPTRCPSGSRIVGTGGISHWPATPDSGKINEAWDRDFLDRWCRNDREALLDYDDARRLRRRRPGRLRDPHVHRRQRRRRAVARHRALLRADPDLRRRLHGRHIRSRCVTSALRELSRSRA